MERKYYSARSGDPSVSRLTLKQVTRLFASVFTSLEEQGFFQQSMGYDCVDAGFVAGTMGEDIGAFFLRKLRKDSLWPIAKMHPSYDRNDVFDVAELLHDHVAAPKNGTYHSWAECGWHYPDFDPDEGRRSYRAEINEFLRDFEDGYELDVNGEIILSGEEGLRDLLEAPLPPSADARNIEDRVRAAVRKYRGRDSTRDDRRDAVRDLADVLEYIRPKLQEVLSKKDEGDLFNIANNFGIRHHNELQKANYDPLWMSWLFYYYLAAVHAIVR